MSRPDFTPQLHTAINTARRTMAEAEQVDGYDIDGVRDSHWELSQALRQLLDALSEDQPARLAVQRDQEFRNLVRATRRELLAVRTALSLLDRFEQALIGMLWPDEDGDQDEPEPEPPAARCAAAHPDDPSPCGGPVVVTVLDERNHGSDGCQHHASRLLASVDRVRVYNLHDVPVGTAARVYRLAQQLQPFPWRGEDQ